MILGLAGPVVVGIAIGVALVASFRALPWLLRLVIRTRLRGYVREANVVDERQPERATTATRVAVLGAGIAGLTAALTLARRGLKVTLIEKNSHLGGKIGSWQVDLAPGTRAWVSHGFHAFFPHYHNLNRFLDSLGIRRSFEAIDDYVILGRSGDLVRFGALDRTPVFNLFALARAGVFRFGEALRSPGRDLYGVFLEYDESVTFKRYDHVSFWDFSRIAEVPPRLKLAFDTFARAFFADERRLSLAELIKSFHFYYLSHDCGLLYAYPTHDYDQAILEPIRLDLEKQGVVVRLGEPVSGLTRSSEGFRVNGEAFDSVVLATDVVGARAIVTGAAGLPPALVSRFAKLVPGQRYAVLRVWLDRDLRRDIPVFVITERVTTLDAVAVYHRLERESAEWVLAHGGSVLELHCYAVPDEVPDDEVKQTLLVDLRRYFPELSEARIVHEVFQINANFTAYHVGMSEDRPEVETGVTGLVCAGDWVKLPFPAMLMEAACASGLVAANRILRNQGLREERLQSVPLRGLMAGLPEPPARARLIPP